jgi:hypothetical protein
MSELKVVTVDGVKFNLAAIAKMERQAFVDEHYHIRLKELKDEGRARAWAAETYDVLMGINHQPSQGEPPPAKARKQKE